MTALLSSGGGDCGADCLCSWKCLGESLLAMYNHLTTCEPPRPSLGKRVDLSDYQDPSQPPVSSVVVAPVNVVQPSPVNASSSMTVAEPVLSYSPVATASFPLHSPSLLETGVPLGEHGPGAGFWGDPGCWAGMILGCLGLSEGQVLLILLV